LKLDYSALYTYFSEIELKKCLQENMEVLQRAQMGEREFEESLGWVEVEEWAGLNQLEFLEKQAERVQADGDILVLIGIGGSNQAARAVIKALNKQGKVEVFYAGNTLSPYQMKRVLEYLENKSVYLNVVAKNFETLEPGMAFRILRQYLKKRYGEAAASRVFATGTKGSRLEELCKEEGYQFLTFPVNVGGRYSAISDVGLFPMAVAGADIRALVQGAGDMAKQLSGIQGTENEAYRYAAFRNLMNQKGYQIEMLSFFEPRFRYFSKWWTQLFAESEGKENKGIYPVASECSEDLHSIGQFVQEGTPIIFETFLEIEEQDTSIKITGDDVLDGFQYLEGMDLDRINRIAFNATRKAHSERFPCFCLSIPRIEEYYLGQLIYFFEYACYLSGRILGIDPFNQPGVENYKSYMFEALGRDKLDRT